ncbi:DUF3237 domain-containing protein [Methylobacterium platani]|uniref:UPF0311 protein A5481_03485 n=2 Tax=Methylobacterium platani TaxID=427683 RepID=A0A179SJS0_9HYPH|nr:DUF3237 domain-containing protein [Methylobacterium platani]KMO18559.1 hypothetical protein SQ03_09940 [Methylobacterium platani JCM 14648]OAS26794.1 hypothetical protein A5481_03485 [Methylobacterium platani]
MPDRDAPLPDRRTLLLAGLAAASPALAGPALAAEQPAPLTDLPLVMPRMEFVYEAVVEIAPLVPLGESPLGERRIVPITGGRFQGPRLRGTVLPGGADRQLVRKDGVRRLDALYEMKTEDGAILTVRNRVTIDPGRDGAPDYRFSTIDVTAPEGPHAWLNRLVLVGTLASLRPAQEAVLVRAFRLA